MKIVFDTNILIDYLLGISQAKEVIERFSKPIISIITYMEVMVGANDEDAPLIADFLRRFEVVDVNKNVAEHAVLLRKAHKIKLPDAIIWATTRHKEAMLFTRDTKDYPAGEIDVRVPYRL